MASIWLLHGPSWASRLLGCESSLQAGQVLLVALADPLKLLQCHLWTQSSVYKPLPTLY